VLYSIQLSSLSIELEYPTKQLAYSLIAFLQAQDNLKSLKIHTLNINSYIVNFMIWVSEALADPMLLTLPMMEELELIGVSEGSVDVVLSCIRSRALSPSLSSKMRLFRVTIPHFIITRAHSRQRGPGGNGGRDYLISRECLIKMKEFLDLPV
jgi:hypothetical protein